ncbi:flagellar biosynthesis anti-sigma factor FlgM [Erythrobacter sp. HA6-11]
MSFPEVQRLQGVSPASALQARDPAVGEKKPASDTSQGSTAAPNAGVQVDVADGIKAGEPPVQEDRVAAVRAALRDGSYPLVPAKIVDAMIAARVSMGIDS